MATKQYAVNTQLDHPAVDQLAQAIEFLRSVCDGAQSRDDQGFSSFDKNLGHYLADQLAAHRGWSQQDLRYAVELAWRYREQLWRAGLSFPLASELQAELEGTEATAQVAVAPTPSTASVTLWRDNGWLALAFSHYDHAKLGQLMSTVPNEDRWWDEANTRWLVNARHEGAMVALYGVAIGEAPAGQAATLRYDDQQPRRTTIAQPGEGEVVISDHDDRRIRVRCPFDLKDALKAAVPWKHRAWDGATKTWLVDVEFREAVEEALEVAA
ncbi:MAG: hypothetical protein HGA45_36265 [Chloroflexales bacterium]|nr:hypothetical protein [Chloroflexales bacterium]